MTNGEPMPADWLAFGHRATDGNEMKVVFGGQVMAHAKMRFDETAVPVSFDAPGKGITLSRWRKK